MARIVSSVAAVLLAGAVVVAPEPIPARADTGSASCTESAITWAVDYTTADTVYGVVMTAVNLRRVEGGASADATSQTWELRWDNLPGAYPPAGTNPPSFGSVQGPLTPSGIGRPIPTYLSPRFLTPDGACTVYLSPFANIGAVASAPAVAVLGDDLVHQLNDSNRNQTALQGHLESSLTGLGVRSEIEGHLGARWSPTAGSSGLAKANSYLLDEFRGLLEHDIDGVVVALGVNDALYIAAGADAAARDARRDEVYNAAIAVAGELSRVGCFTLVTAPENASTLDPDYAWAALQVNNLFRFLTALGTATDAGELVDFGTEAKNHKPTDAVPWFGADGVHLAGAGLDAYTGALTRAAQRCADSVVLWGAPGTLDDPFVTGRSVMPAGQAFNTRAVAGWDFGPSRAAHFSTVTADGTIFFMTGGTGGNVFAANGEGMQLSAFNPDARTFANIPIKTDRNVTVPRAPCPDDLIVNGAVIARWTWCDTDPNVSGELFGMGGWVGDVATLHGGNAVAFTGYQSYLKQDVVTQGVYPAFGVVSRGVNGAWQVVEGPDGNGDGLPDWRNAWSPTELYDATVAAAVPSGPDAVEQAKALADSICPLSVTDLHNVPTRDCGSWVNEIAVLPQSHDVVVAHYGTGKLSVIDVSEPGPGGRITARITAVYDLPDIQNPADPSKMITPAPREVQADPSSTLGDERFGLQSDFAPGLIEFSYNANAAAPADRIRPVSAPVLSGERWTPPLSTTQEYVGYGQFHYDQAGNLWVPTTVGTTGLGVKIYAKTANGRKITRAECLEYVNGQPKPIQSYVAQASGTRPAWGKTCLPDFNISQPRILGPIYGLEEDPTTHDIVLTDWAHGITTVVRSSGSGTAMTFQVGNITDPMTKRTSADPVTVSTPCSPLSPGDSPTGPCTRGAYLGEMQGPVDAKGRLWIAVQQFVPGPIGTASRQMHMRRLDQWIYSVDISRLLGREPTQLTARSGQATVVQAEQVRTMATVQTPGTTAVTEVRSTAPVRPCMHRMTVYGPQTCTDPVTGIAGGGYALGDDAGVAQGMTAEYRVVVPKAGTYTLTYRATDRGAAGAQNLELTVNGATHTTEITSGDSPPYASMKDHVLSTPITLPAGVHTVRITAPQGGWELDWIRFART
ncbi:carbohydrate-binding protein [Nonomuraea sp. NPDC050556]|uniref:carbohydrate-binding protein n=1 Tax=Nonomuraea sp. NPDC050556 TaxID=3364369 RepID=UPI0037B62181